MPTLLACDGTHVAISKAAASVSVYLQPFIDSEEPISTSSSALSLQLLSSVAQAIVDRQRPAQSADPMHLLEALDPAQLIALHAASQQLSFNTVERLAVVPLTELLRGRSAHVLRVVLDAPDDLTADEKTRASSEPLLTPPSVADINAASADGDVKALVACLNDLDARSLRSLKGVSRSWRRRVRAVLGDPTSAWRRAPEWSAGAWAEQWFTSRLASDDPQLRKRALLAMDALEAAVELPRYLPVLLGTLTPEERSSHRALALRHLARLEPPTLALHMDALGVGLAHLEPHEADTEAAATLRRVLGGSPRPDSYLAALSAGGLTASLSPRSARAGSAPQGAAPSQVATATAKRPRGECARAKEDLRCVLQRRRAAVSQAAVAPGQS